MSRIAKLAPIVAPLNKLIFYDDFNRTDGAVGKAPTGQTWQDASTFAISSGKLMATSVTMNIAYVDTGIKSPLITCDVVWGNSMAMWLIMNPARVFGLLLSFDYGNKWFRLTEYSNSTSTHLTGWIPYTGRTGATPFNTTIETDCKSYVKINGDYIISGGSFDKSYSYIQPPATCFGLRIANHIATCSLDNLKAEEQ